MSTLSYILIKHNRLLDIEDEIKSTYEIGEREVLKQKSLYKYYDKIKRNRTFIIHQEYSDNWISIEYELQNLYEFDELLRRITKKYETNAIIGYNQTTSGDVRFAYFENGKLERSIYQKEIHMQSQFRTIDNYGKRLSFEEKTYNSTINKPIGENELIDFYDDIQNWFKYLGFNWYEREIETDYLHLEIINFKNE